MSLGGRSLGEEGMFVAGFEPSATLRTLWLPGAGASGSNSPSVGAGANVHLAGHLTESLDMDPGTGTDVRLPRHPGGGSGFSSGLDLNGAYRNAHVYDVEPSAIHETPGGGSLVHLSHGFPPSPTGPNLVAYYSDGSPAWTLRTGVGYYVELVASSTHFAVVGVEERSSLGADELAFTSNDQVVVHRYAF
jgi:hypothetical protein